MPAVHVVLGSAEGIGSRVIVMAVSIFSSPAVRMPAYLRLGAREVERRRCVAEQQIDFVGPFMVHLQWLSTVHIPIH